MQRIKELAVKISEKSPVAIWGIKKVLAMQYRKETHDVLDYISALNMSLLQSEDVTTAITASL